jgi:hypothetical protein
MQHLCRDKIVYVCIAEKSFAEVKIVLCKESRKCFGCFFKSLFLKYYKILSMLTDCGCSIQKDDDVSYVLTTGLYNIHNSLATDSSHYSHFFLSKRYQRPTFGKF